MPDYSAILRRSIDSLPDNSPAMRQAVYDRARAALARQLTAVDPPLSADDLEAQHQQLEDAIADIENAVLRGDDPALAGIDWDAIDNEFAEFEAAGTAAAKPPPTPRRAAAARPRQPMPEPDIAPEPDFPPEPRPGARFAPEPGMAFDEPDLEVAAHREPRQRRSRAPFYIFVVLLLMIAGGLSAFAYTQWGFVQQMAQTILAETVTARTDDPSGVSSEPPRPFAEAPQQTDAGDDAAGKSEDRLGDVGATAAVSTGTDVPATGGTAPASSNLVGQKAIFYEQAADGAPGQAQEGAVAWSQVTREDGSPAIEAKIDIPTKGLSAVVTILRNNDAALPASHLIEVDFRDVSGLLPATIDRVPALVMKPNEQARGQALAAAAVPVTEKLFWIALSSDADAVQRNLVLMRDGAWFDMPLLFKDGSRALVTFEKGIPGDQVFETVMATWAPS